jgi:2,4-dienoyl-CoA reductase-like NADH-dependent reductase (Old Yellow Enzyme family)
MTRLFETTTIENMALANRLIRSATYECLAGDDGSCTPELIDLMARLAKASVGLIVTGLAYVSPEGVVAPKQMGIYSDALLPGLTKMTEAVHANEGKIAIQIMHGGAEAPYTLTGVKAMGPSERKGETGLWCRPMAQEDIDRVVQDFGKAAALARKAGFDAVQIHAAHGWLLSQFLSPYFNERTDVYGGSVHNRAKILLDVYSDIRDAVGLDFPVLIKINSEDFLDNGFTVDDFLTVAGLLETAGIAAIEMSGGTRYSGQFFWSRKGSTESQVEEVYYRETAERYKCHIRVPLTVTGGIRSYEVAEELLNQRICDYIGLCRPLIREPELCKRWKSGDTRKAACNSCNLCRRALSEGKGLYCVMEKPASQEKG